MGVVFKAGRRGRSGRWRSRWVLAGRPGLAEGDRAVPPEPRRRPPRTIRTSSRCTRSGAPGVSRSSPCGSWRAARSRCASTGRPRDPRGAARLVEPSPGPPPRPPAGSSPPGPEAGNILLDFRGIALHHRLRPGPAPRGDPAITRVGLALGTPGYMAPEQVEDADDVTAATDVYGLGAVLFSATHRPAALRGPTPYRAIEA